MRSNGQALLIDTHQEGVNVLVELLDPRFDPLRVVCRPHESYYPPLCLHLFGVSRDLLQFAVRIVSRVTLRCMRRTVKQ